MCQRLLGPLVAPNLSTESLMLDVFVTKNIGHSNFGLVICKTAPFWIQANRLERTILRGSI